MNPMLLFDRSVPPQKLAQLQQLRVLLGGLGQLPASQVISPSLARPPTQPEVQKEGSILGGTGSG